MYFAYDEDDDYTLVGTTLDNLLVSIEENHYSGVSAIPSLQFYKAEKIEVKYEAKLTQVVAKKPTAKKTGAKR